jgi:hypothetical protein
LLTWLQSVFVTASTSSPGETTDPAQFEQYAVAADNTSISSFATAVYSTRMAGCKL